jgi:O-antigen ligase
MLGPGRARPEGRLSGAIWPIPATQVAHYAAVTLGLVVVLWLGGHRRGRATMLTVVVTGIILIMTHTRTALVGLIVGLLIAGLSMIVVKTRVRKLFAIGGAVVLIAVTTLSNIIISWLTRGESGEQLTSLTGRTKFWGPLLAFPRDRFQEIFGFGLSNDSFNGQAIDSNWLTSYQDQGLFGVVVCAVILLFLFILAYLQPSGVRRAIALFLITYCLMASFTEVGFTNASTYLLDLTLAASLLVPSAVKMTQYED